MTNNWNEIPKVTAEPDFDNLLAVLKREKPKRSTLFEFFLNPPLYEKLAGKQKNETLTIIHAFKNAGYDYSTFLVPGFDFPVKEVEQKASRSINDGAVIVDRSSFESCKWQEPEFADYDILKRIAPEVPNGMKLVVAGSCGVLENAIRL